MRRSKVFGIVSIPIVSAALLLAGAGEANSAVPRSDHSVASADAKGYIIVNSTDGVSTKGGTFFPTGKISADTLVVIAEPDGSLPDGITEGQIAQLVAQRRASAPTVGATSTIAGPSSTANYPHAYSATSAAWSSAFTGTYVIGSPGATEPYAFNVNIGTGQQNAGQGLGYYRGYQGSTFGTWAKWYDLAAADADTIGGGTVPWGNVAASAKFKARCATSTVCGGYFSP